MFFPNISDGLCAIGPAHPGYRYALDLGRSAILRNDEVDILMLAIEDCGEVSVATNKAKAEMIRFMECS